MGMIIAPHRFQAAAGVVSDNPILNPAADDLPHRYWRLEQMANVNDSIWLGLKETEWAESIGGADVSSTAFVIKSAEPLVDGAVTNAVDNNTGTEWQWSNGVGNGSNFLSRWWGQDFGVGNAKTIREFRATPQSILNDKGTALKNFTLSYSDDNVSYTPKFTVTNAGYGTGIQNRWNDTGPYFNGVPTISGGTTSGSTLTVTLPACYPVSGLSLQWTRDGAPISGATGSSYVTTTADRNKAITCVATVTYGANSRSLEAPSITVVDYGPELFVPASATYTGGWSRSGGNIVAVSAANRVEQTGIFTIGATYVFSIIGNKTAGSGARLRIVNGNGTTRYLSPSLGNSAFNLSGSFVADGTVFQLEADTNVITCTIPESTFSIKQRLT